MVSCRFRLDAEGEKFGGGGGGQKASEGVEAEQVPLQPMVPEFVMPQEFGAELQLLP